MFHEIFMKMIKNAGGGLHFFYLFYFIFLRNASGKVIHNS